MVTYFVVGCYLMRDGARVPVAFEAIEATDLTVRQAAAIYRQAARQQNWVLLVDAPDAHRAILRAEWSMG
jgi:hypothetical protein